MAKTLALTHDKKNQAAKKPAKSDAGWRWGICIKILHLNGLPKRSGYLKTKFRRKDVLEKILIF